MEILMALLSGIVFPVLFMYQIINSAKKTRRLKDDMLKIRATALANDCYMGALIIHLEKLHPDEPLLDAEKLGATARSLTASRTRHFNQ